MTPETRFYHPLRLVRFFVVLFVSTLGSVSPFLDDPHTFLAEMALPDLVAEKVDIFSLGVADLFDTLCRDADFPVKEREPAFEIAGSEKRV